VSARHGASRSPVLLVTTDDDFRWFPYTAPRLTWTSFELVRCVGSSNGWLALSFAWYHDPNVFVLDNPINAIKVVLLPLMHEKGLWVTKVVFAPRPTKDDFTVAAICGVDRITYITVGARWWAIMDPVYLVPRDHLES
jgi:hypothetical protein